jgi:hypothetical protein
MASRQSTLGYVIHICYGLGRNQDIGATSYVFALPFTDAHDCRSPVESPGWMTSSNSTENEAL